MKARVVIMQAAEHLWLDLSELGFIGQQQQPMQGTWLGRVNPVSVTPKSHAPATDLMTIPLAWPVAQWRLDQVGPMPKSSPGGPTHLLVAVDKFTKWIEAIPVTNQEAKTVVKFCKGITCCFGVPHSIITDNGTNFSSNEFHEFCEDNGIKLSFALVSHPQTNGQVKRING
jgi:hypothetical protein